MKIMVALSLIMIGLILAFFYSSRTPGCGSGKEMSLCSFDRKKVKAKLLEKVPLGSSIANAETFMKKEGFECRIILKGGFSEFGDDTEGKPINEQENIDFLSCSKTVLDAGVAAIFCKAHWNIGLVAQDESMKDVLINYRRVCP